MILIVIGFNPSTSLLEGLKETWEWFVQNQDEYLRKKNYFADDGDGEKG